MPAEPPQPICRQVFDTQQLVAAFPPRLRDRNKKVVYRLASPPGCVHAGPLVVSRWPPLALPASISPEMQRTVLAAREDGFGYEPPPDGPVREWYLNFAHFDLFCAYGGPAFAQDEVQVAEHPALGSLREALLTSATLLPLTVENGEPTPVLVRGVERRCAVATERNSAAGRPEGLYGSRFSQAKAAVVEQAVRLLVPPTRTNLIAIEAPSYGNGDYRQAEIEYILRTAYAGFRAAVLESQYAADGAAVEVVIHTGFWGCGAYGGNRVLMALLQFLAAHLAGVQQLIFHTFDRAGSEAYATALHLWQGDLASANSTVAAVCSRIQSLGLRWGTSDGN